MRKHSRADKSTEDSNSTEAETNALDYGLPKGLEGETTVEIECAIPETNPEFCDGWSEAYELDGESFLNDRDRVVLPGFGWCCPECGDSCFRVNGVFLQYV